MSPLCLQQEKVARIILFASACGGRVGLSLKTGNCHQPVFSRGRLCGSVCLHIRGERGGAHSKQKPVDMFAIGQGCADHVVCKCARGRGGGSPSRRLLKTKHCHQHVCSGESGTDHFVWASAPGVKRIRPKHVTARDFRSARPSLHLSFQQ